MDSLYLSFVMVSIGLILLPGPNVLYIVSTSLKHGAARGLYTVAGTTFAMLLQMCIAAIGTSWFIRIITDGFSYIKWFGVLYLVIAGVQSIFTGLSNLPDESAPGAGKTMARGFLISLTNPKTILFFSAFMPQFITPSDNYLYQFALLCATFLFLAMIFDSCYALLSFQFKTLVKNRLNQLPGIVGGGLMVGAGLWLAVFERR